MFEFNLLVTYSLDFLGARKEIDKVLKLIGDESPSIRRTIVKGIIGVFTSLDVHHLSSKLEKIALENPKIFYFTQRWIPIDIWTISDIPNMKEGVKKVAKIESTDRWKMVVEKRKYEVNHVLDIIKELAEVVGGKVDLRKPEKILRIDILGPYAGISLLQPNEIFSVLRSRN